MACSYYIFQCDLDCIDPDLNLTLLVIVLSLSSSASFGQTLRRISNDRDASCDTETPANTQRDSLFVSSAHMPVMPFTRFSAKSWKCPVILYE